MSNAVLIAAPVESLGKKIGNKYLQDGWQVFITVPPDQYNPGTADEGQEEDQDEQKTEPETLHVIPWDSRAGISAANVLRIVKREAGQLKEAVIIQDFLTGNQPIHEVQPSEIEHAVDQVVKGFLYITRSVLQTMLPAREGTISLISAGDPGYMNPLNATLTAGFNGLCDSIFSLYQNEPLVINAFSADGAPEEEFASYFYSTLKERARNTRGKWYRFGKRNSIFSGLMGRGGK